MNKKTKKQLLRDLDKNFGVCPDCRKGVPVRDMQIIPIPGQVVVSFDFYCPRCDQGVMQTLVFPNASWTNELASVFADMMAEVYC